MTKAQFRGVLVVYFLFLAGRRFAPYSRESIIPQVVRQAEPSTSPTVGLLSALGILLFVVGMVGMFFFWRPSRYVFVCGMLLYAGVILFDSPWFAGIAWGGFCGYIQHVLQGVIVVLAFVGPAHTFFEKRASINSIQPTSALAGARG